MSVPIFLPKVISKAHKKEEGPFTEAGGRVQRSRLSQSTLNLYEEPGIPLLNGSRTAERNTYEKDLMGQIEIILGQVLKLILK